MELSECLGKLWFTQDVLPYTNRILTMHFGRPLHEKRMMLLKKAKAKGKRVFGSPQPYTLRLIIHLETFSLSMHT